MSPRAAYTCTVATLCVAGLLQLAIYRHGGHTALGDIPGRFFAWRLGPHSLPYIDRPVEYPPVIGLLAYLVALFGRTAGWFFLLTALFSAALALVMTGLLGRYDTPRLTRWVVGLPVALYAFHNWDLVAMVPLVLGITAFESGSDGAAGAWLALGMSAKVFPGLLIPPLAAKRWFDGDRRGAIRLVVGAVVVTLAINVPIAVASWDGWSYPARFQGARHATWGSLLSWVTSPPWGGRWTVGDPAQVANVAAAGLLAAGLVTISYLGVRRRLGAAAIGMATVGVFMLTNKVYSPNYDLWLVPFFVLLPIGRRYWIAFCAADLAVFVVVFGRFHGLLTRHLGAELVPYVIFARAVVVVALIAIALRPLRPEDSPERAPGRPEVPRLDLAR